MEIDIVYIYIYGKETIKLLCLTWSIYRMPIYPTPLLSQRPTHPSEMQTLYRQQSLTAHIQSSEASPFVTPRQPWPQVPTDSTAVLQTLKNSREGRTLSIPKQLCGWDF